jgi:hypothetical protein
MFFRVQNVKPYRLCLRVQYATTPLSVQNTAPIDYPSDALQLRTLAGGFAANRRECGTPASTPTANPKPNQLHRQLPQWYHPSRRCVKNSEGESWGLPCKRVRHPPGAVIGNIEAEADYAAAQVYNPAYNYFQNLGLSARQSTVGAVTFYNHGHMGQIANVLAQSQALGYSGYAGLDNLTPLSGGNYTSNVISIATNCFGYDLPDD